MLLLFLRPAVAWLLSGLLFGAARPSLHAQHRFTLLHSFGATNLPAAPRFYLVGVGD